MSASGGGRHRTASSLVLAKARASIQSVTSRSPVADGLRADPRVVRPTADSPEAKGGGQGMADGERGWSAGRAVGADGRTELTHIPLPAGTGLRLPASRWLGEFLHDVRTMDALLRLPAAMGAPTTPPPDPARLPHLKRSSLHLRVRPERMPWDLLVVLALLAYALVLLL